jgi:predicted transcriptional regulator of viral defense system
MNIYECLSDKFNADEPILVEDIESMFSERSRPWIDKSIKTMIDSNQIKRFSTGVYYIPRKTVLGDSILDPRKVITRKYIANNDDVYGYFGGTTLLNHCGLTTQVPNTITIVTNNESTRGRRISIGNQKVYLTKPTVNINNDNSSILQFFELIKLVDFDKLDEIELDNLKKYIDDNNITLSMVSKYCSSFPDSVSRKILGGPLIAKLAQ